MFIASCLIAEDREILQGLGSDAHLIHGQDAVPVHPLAEGFKRKRPSPKRLSKRPGVAVPVLAEGIEWDRVGKEPWERSAQGRNRAAGRWPSLPLMNWTSGKPGPATDCLTSYLIESRSKVTNGPTKSRQSRWRSDSGAIRRTSVEGLKTASWARARHDGQESIQQAPGPEALIGGDPGAERPSNEGTARGPFTPAGAASASARILVLESMTLYCSSKGRQCASASARTLRSVFSAAT